jgi:hypothetical protein
MLGPLLATSRRRRHPEQKVLPTLIRSIIGRIRYGQTIPSIVTQQTDPLSIPVEALQVLANGLQRVSNRLDQRQSVPTRAVRQGSMCVRCGNDATDGNS